MASDLLHADPCWTSACVTRGRQGSGGSHAALASRKTPSQTSSNGTDIMPYDTILPLTGIYPNDGLIAENALLLIDLDRFKPVNDTYGHAIGDAVLSEIVERIKVILQDEHRLYRLGGDEIVIFPQPVGNGAARALGEDIVRTCSEPMSIEGLNIDIGACVGLAHAVPAIAAGTCSARLTLRSTRPNTKDVVV